LFIDIKEIIKMSNNTAIAKQISYYLGDENLAQDEFFYKEIASNKYSTSITQGSFRQA